MCSSTTDWDLSPGLIRDYRILPRLKFKSTPCLLVKRLSIMSRYSSQICVKLSQKDHTKPLNWSMKKSTQTMLKSTLNTRRTTSLSLTMSMTTMLMKKATMTTMLTKKATMTTMLTKKATMTTIQKRVTTTSTVMMTAMKVTTILLLKTKLPTLQDVLLTHRLPSSTSKKENTSWNLMLKTQKTSQWQFSRCLEVMHTTTTVTMAITVMTMATNMMTTVTNTASVTT